MLRRSKKLSNGSGLSRQSRRKNRFSSGNSPLRMEQLEQRDLLAGLQYVDVQLDFVDAAGNSIDQVVVGEKFFIEVHAQDIRDPADADNHPSYFLSNDPEGVSSFFIDLKYNDAFQIDLNDPIKADPSISSFLGGETIIPYSIIDDTNSSDRYLNDVGATDFDIMPKQGDKPYLWMTIPMVAGNNSGIFDFEAVYASTVTDNAQAFNPITLLRTGQTPLPDFLINFDSDQLIVVNDNVAFTSDVEIRVVKNRTTVDSQGEVSTLPQNEQTLIEWDQYFIEVFAKAPANFDLKTISVEVDFNGDYFDAVSLEDISDDSSLKFQEAGFDNSSSENTVKASFSTPFTNSGDDKYALVGRIVMGPDMGETGGVPIEATNDYIKPVETTVDLVSASATLSDPSGNPNPILTIAPTTIGSDAMLDVWAVMYDVDDSGDVGLTDLVSLVGQFGNNVNNANTYPLDFDHDDVIGLSDLVLLIQNFGISRANGDQLTFSSAFPDEFLIPGGIPMIANLLEPEFIEVEVHGSDQDLIEVEPAAPQVENILTIFPLNISQQQPSTVETENADQILAEDAPELFPAEIEDQTALIDSVTVGTEIVGESEEEILEIDLYLSMIDEDEMEF